MFNTLAALLLLAHFLNSPGRGAEPAPATAITAAWRVDLRSGLPGKPAGISSGGKGHEYTYSPEVSLWFTDENTVAMTIVTRVPATAPKPTLSHGNEPNESWPLRLHAVFLNAASGKEKAVANWPARSTYSRIVAVDSGKIVTESGNQLTLYARDLTVLKRLQLPSAPLGDLWLASPSPSGKHVLFVASDFRIHGPVGWIWVDTEGLRIVRSWNDIQSGWVGISDDRIAMETCWFPDCPPGPRLAVRTLGAGWNVIAPIGRHMTVTPQFLYEDLIALVGGRILILRPDGETVGDEATPMGGCYYWNNANPAPAANGRRFIVPTCKEKRPSGFLELGGWWQLTKIFVYDAPFRGQPEELDLNGLRVQQIGLMALSPDGSKLAVLDGLTLSVYTLPPEQKWVRKLSPN